MNEKYRPSVIRPGDHEAWLAERDKGIGASEVAAVVGLSPWDTPFSLWLRKTGQIPRPEETQAMKMGHLLEPVVVQLWEMETGFKAVKSSAADIIYFDPEHPWRRVTPDRIAYETMWLKKRKVLLEIKTTSKDIDPCDIPKNYLCQCQYQMHVTGVHVCYLCWLTNGRYYGSARLEYDEEFATWLAGEVDDFYNRCIIGGEEPLCIQASDFQLKGAEEGKAIEADSEALEDLKELRTIKTSINDLEGQEDSLTDKIKMYMQDAEALTLEGETLATWKEGKKGRTFLLKNKKIEEFLMQQENEFE